MKKGENFHFGVGTSSILMIFVILCLTVFGVLSFSTARADQRLTEKALAGTAAYYDADARAEEALAQIDGILSDAEAMPGNYLDEAAEALKQVGVSVSEENDTICGELLFTIQENQVYCLAFRVDEDGGYQVTARQVKNVEDVWGQDHLNVWDGK